MSLANIFVTLLGAYFLIGLLFGAWFVFKGVSRVDAGMTEAKWNLRLLLLPGAMAFWPLLLRKYLNAKK